MKRLFFLYFFCILFANGNENPSNVIDCNIIFEQRKSELINQLREIEEQKRLMTTLYNQQQAQNDKKLQELELKEQKVESLLKEVKDKEQEIRDLIKQNEEILANIQNVNSEKISQTYSQMRDSKAAPIIENMPLKDAAELLYSMQAKDMGKILSKMTPQRAAKLTEMLRLGPPFEDLE
ncbi:MotE family protein [Helicobacter sp. MIT 99-5507]|uniref:MotE family protein n=1 Tax=Helicobacter sp. MIT 99-5507 TaxID=152489 RepID=UPI000E1ECFBB|nr:MotE family protein [Helicobacter sp. MIT 99-5507]RDU57870.1 PDP protein [Helicobacter sp. MIT 99-5507]